MSVYTDVNGNKYVCFPNLMDDALEILDMYKGDESNEWNEK